MSFYIDPWLYNCTANPADSPAEQREQKLIIEATQRAIDYARAHGVTTIAAEGNGHTDLGNPTSDDTSPDYPDQAPRRTRARSTTAASRCRPRPTASSASRRWARASARRTTPTTASSRPTSPRPGGDASTTPHAALPRPTRSSPPTRSPSAARPATIGPDGTPTTPLGRQAGQRLLPVDPGHLDGLPARGRRRGADRGRVRQERPANGGVTLSPDRVEQVLRRTATDTPCPTPRTFVTRSRPGALHGHVRGQRLAQRVLRRRASSTRSRR